MSKGRKVKSLGIARDEQEIFWMSLEEAKRAIADKYDYLVDEEPRRQKFQHGIKKATS